MKKRIALLLCMISCLALLAGCSLTKVNKNLNESDLTKNAETFVSQWFGYDFASTVKQYESQMTEDEVRSGHYRNCHIPYRYHELRHRSSAGSEAFDRFCP